ncbi:hypothetical protein ACGF7U_15155 [Micromonospora sp. NPDC047670]
MGGTGALGTAADLLATVIEKARPSSISSILADSSYRLLPA